MVSLVANVEVNGQTGDFLARHQKSKTAMNSPPEGSGIFPKLRKIPPIPLLPRELPPFETIPEKIKLWKKLSRLQNVLR